MYFCRSVPVSVRIRFSGRSSYYWWRQWFHVLLSTGHSDSLKRWWPMRRMDDLLLKRKRSFRQQQTVPVAAAVLFIVVLRQRLLPSQVNATSSWLVASSQPMERHSCAKNIFYSTVIPATEVTDLMTRWTRLLYETWLTEVSQWFCAEPNKLKISACYRLAILLLVYKLSWHALCVCTVALCSVIQLCLVRKVRSLFKEKPVE